MRTAIRFSTAPTRRTSTASSPMRRPRLPGRPSLYGHGLLGSAGEVGSSPQRSLAQAHNFVFCATDEIGFASEDIPNTIGILAEHGPLPRAHRPHPAGAAERALPRAAHGQRRRLRQQRRVPRGRRHAGEPAGDRHVEAVLQRQQPGRHPRRRADRGLPGLHPGVARRPGDGVLDPADQVDRLRHLLVDPLPGVPERALTPAGAVAGRRCSGTARSRTATRTG